ncbi:MAG: CBS domain-containing protein [Catenulispora sp.]|nr:CBS domain-containing protein [Catenulispora sp.]
MATVATIMTEAVEYVDAHDPLAAAARRMRDMNVGALPVRGPDDRLMGIITDRDIVVKAVASDLDPRECPVRNLIDTEPVCVGAQEEIEEAAAMMAEHRIRRLPVVDGDQLVGMVAQADLARALPPEHSGRVVQDISSAP